MRLNKSILLWTSLILLLSALACSGSRFEQLADPAAAEARVAAVSTRSVEAAATAAVLAGQAQEIAAIVVEEGSQAVATLQASDLTLPTVADLQQLQARISSVLPDENGNVTITIMESELNQLLQQAQAEALAQGNSQRIENTAVRFTDGLIIVTGTVTEPFRSNLAVSFKPIVTGNALHFRIEAATIGDVPVPPALLGAAEATLNNTLGEALAQLPEAVALHNVTVSEGMLLVLGGRG